MSKYKVGVLKEYMLQKNITANELYERIGKVIPLDSLRKYQSGERPYTKDKYIYLDRIFTALSLTKKEKYNFIEAVIEDNSGKEKLLEYKKIGKMMYSITRDENVGKIYDYKIINQPITYDLPSVLSSKRELLDFIEDLFLAFDKLSLITIDVNTELYHILERVVHKKKFESIRHINVISNNGEHDKIMNKINILEKSLGIYFVENNYCSMFDYTNEDLMSLSLLPNVIVTDSIVLRFNYDYSKGVVYTNKHIIKSHKDTTNHICKELKPIIEEKVLTGDYLTNFYNDENSTFIIATPSLVKYFNVDELKNFKLTNLDHKYYEKIINRIKTIKQKRTYIKNKIKSKVYMTKQGISRFANFGLTFEIPEEYMESISNNARIQLLERYKRNYRNNDCNIIDLTEFNVDGRITLQFRDTDINLIYTTDHLDKVSITIKDYDIVTMVNEYLNMVIQISVLPEEEVNEYLDQVINGLKDNL